MKLLALDKVTEHSFCMQKKAWGRSGVHDQVASDAGIQTSFL
jgi:hypothetical protein